MSLEDKTAASLHLYIKPKGAHRATRKRKGWAAKRPARADRGEEAAGPNNAAATRAAARGPVRGGFDGEEARPSGSAVGSQSMAARSPVRGSIDEEEAGPSDGVCQPDGNSSHEVAGANAPPGPFAADAFARALPNLPPQFHSQDRLNFE